MNRIAFILCTNDPLYLSECEKYIRQLVIPDGFDIDILPVTGARSMCAGYNAAMRASDARYKIYLHQDTLILNRYFAENILSLFRAHPNAGMIGMVGATRLTSAGIMWKSGHNEIGALYKPTDDPYLHDRASNSWPTANVLCADGFLMATQVDIPWREDLFDGWDFYDASQGLEFHRHGYEVLIPDQACAWCLHDDGRILNLYHYDHYRKIFLREYGDEIGASLSDVGLRESLLEEQKDEAAYLTMLKRLEHDEPIYQAETARITALADAALASHDVGAFLAISEEFAIEPGRSALTKSTELLRLKQMTDAVRTERKLGLPTFIDTIGSFQAFREKYVKITFAMRAIEFNTLASSDALEQIRDYHLSAFSAAAILYNIISLLGHREKILLTIAGDALDRGDPYTAYLYLAAIQNPTPDTLALRDELGKAVR